MRSHSKNNKFDQNWLGSKKLKIIKLNCNKLSKERKQHKKIHKQGCGVGVFGRSRSLQLTKHESRKKRTDSDF